MKDPKIAPLRDFDGNEYPSDIQAAYRAQVKSYLSPPWMWPLFYASIIAFGIFFVWLLLSFRGDNAEWDHFVARCHSQHGHVYSEDGLCVRGDKILEKY